MMASKRSLIAARFIPSKVPLRYTFSRPDSSGSKPGTELQQGRDPSEHVDRPCRRPQHARDDLQHGALARAVAPDDAQPLTGRDFQRDVFECPEVVEAELAAHREQQVFLDAAHAATRYSVTDADVLEHHDRVVGIVLRGRQQSGTAPN